jgi:uncharacterized membrane protein
MYPNFTSYPEFKNVMNVLFAIIVASCIIIIITTNINDSNSLSALIGGYFGLSLGLLFIIILNLVFKQSTYVDMIPLFIIIIIIGLLLTYLFIYFNEISSGKVSSYYSKFSLLSTIFLFTQLIIIFSTIYNKSKSNVTQLFTNTTFSLLGLFSVINIIIVLTIGIILHFYSTQG